MYDIVIIGAGPGGYETALYAAKNGLKVALIEENEIGGTCLNCGCIPTKTYYAAAKHLFNISKMNSYGITSQVEFELSKLVKRKEEVVEELKKGILFLIDKSNIDFIKERGYILSPHKVLVNAEELEAQNIIIATGSKPLTGIIPGDEFALTSNDILNMTELPQSIAIIGGGVIGIEIASIFACFGTKVEVIEIQSNILPMFDDDVSKRLRVLLSKIGVKFHLKSTINKIIDKNTLEIKEKDNLNIMKTDCILMAIGRKPNIQDIFPEELISVDKKGIITNEFFQTNISNIYAIGDCNGKMQLAHYATYSGYYVIDKILNKPSFTNFNLVPSCVFTFPELSKIGLTESEAQNQGLTYEVKKISYRSNGKALSMNEGEGFIKLIISDNVILGVTICGENSSDLIHELSILMNKNILLEEFNKMIFAHPTLSELLKNI